MTNRMTGGHILKNGAKKKAKLMCERVNVHHSNDDWCFFQIKSLFELETGLYKQLFVHKKLFAWLKNVAKQKYCLIFKANLCFNKILSFI